MLATSKEILLNVKEMAFTKEIISKTRDGGLPWVKVEDNLYRVTICQPARCSIPALPTKGWTYYVLRNTTPEGDFTYWLEVLLDDSPFLSLSSREVSFVETLYKQVEVSQKPLCDRKSRRALRFISRIPTSPSSDRSDFVMCGGAEVGGDGTESVTYKPPKNAKGVVLGGGAKVVHILKPVVKGGAVLGGEALYKAVIQNAGVEGTGSAAVGVVSNNFVAVASRHRLLLGGTVVKQGSAALTVRCAVTGTGRNVRLGRASLAVRCGGNARPNAAFRARASLTSSTSISPKPRAIWRGRSLMMSQASVSVTKMLDGSANLHAISTTTSDGSIFCIMECLRYAPIASTNFPASWSLHTWNIMNSGWFGGPSSCGLCEQANGIFTLTWSSANCDWRYVGNGVSWSLYPSDFSGEKGDLWTLNCLTLVGEILSCPGSKISTTILSIYPGDATNYYFVLDTDGSYCQSQGEGATGGMIQPQPPFYSCYR